MPRHTDTDGEVAIPNHLLLPHVVALINEGHTATIALRGVSMRPFLEDGRDKAVLAKPGSVRVGDAVLAHVKPRVWVLHRVVAVRGDSVTLLGDGNLVPEHCRRDDVKAVVTAFYRKGRKRPDRTDGMKWRLYSWCWMRLRPLRRYLLTIYRIMTRL